MSELNKALSLFDNIMSSAEAEKQKNIDTLELMKEQTDEKFRKQGQWIEKNFEKAKPEHIKALFENGVMLVKIKGEIEKINSV